MPERQSAPDFSTSYWREFKLKYPRPAVYIPVAVAYLVFVSAAGLGAHKWDQWMSSLVVVYTALIAVISAVVGAGFFASRRRLLAIRKAAAVPGTGLVSADRMPSIVRLLLQVCVPFGLALLLLSPIYAGAGSLGHVGGFAPGLAVGASWCLIAALGVLAAAACGAFAGMVAPPRFTIHFGLGAGLLFAFIRIMCFFFVNANFVDHYAGDELQHWHRFVAADAVLSVAVGTAMILAASRALLIRAQDVSVHYDSEAEVLADAPEGLGMAITFWALLRWRFWADPVYRAERRQFWSVARVIIMWLAATAWAVAGWFGCWELRVDRQATLLDLGALVPAALPMLIAAGMMVVGCISDKRNGVLETLLLTPVAPLRMAASKLLARSRHLCLAAALLLASGVIIYWIKLGFQTTYDYYYRGAAGWRGMGGLWYWSLCAIMLFTAVLGVLAYGAVGLRFAARCRTLMAALSLTYFFTIACMLLSEIGFLYIVHDVFRWRTRTFGMFMVSLLRLVLLGTILRVFLMGAARQLVLRRGE